MLFFSSRKNGFLYTSMISSQENLTEFCKLTNAFFHFNIDVLKD